MNFSISDVVILNTFLGTKIPPNKVKTSENYWLLIGMTGVVAMTEEQTKMPQHRMGQRVLVTFDIDVTALGLACHNKVRNSLWIFVSDLNKGRKPA